ncbi:MAG: histidinol-phosphate transaminase [Clostridiales bacterium]|nr:histidinol-phosphate transaminase [Clostridiales bacterium]
MDNKKFLSPYLWDLTPYVPGYQPENTEGLIKLNTNENPYPPSPKAVQAMHNAIGEKLKLYPSFDCLELRGAIAKEEGLKTENVFVGNGSDEVLSLCFPAFFKQEKPIAFFDITYAFYKVYCKFYEVDYDLIPLNEDFTAPLDAFNGQYGGVLIANPNAPTSIANSLEEIEAVLKRNPDCVVLVDEAYQMFWGQTAAGLIERYPNLLVVRTLSKGYSLAGLRAAYALGQPHLIRALINMRDSFNSYNLDAIALAGATAAIEDSSYAKANAKKVMETRATFSRGLEELGYTVLPSSANFVFARPGDGDAERIFQALGERNIYVRYFTAERIKEWLRISIGTAEEMERVLAALKEIG